MAALSPTAPVVAWPPLGLGGLWVVVYSWGCMLGFRDLWSFPAALTQQRRISAAEPGAGGGAVREQRGAGGGRQP